MNNFDFLLSSFKNSAQTDYINKCDLINKYGIANTFDLPSISTVSVTYDSSSIENFIEEDLIKFQIVLLYYFLFLFLPNFFSKNKILFTSKVSDKLRIEYLLNYFFFENSIVLKKKIKNFKLLKVNPKSITMLKIDIEILTKNFNFNKDMLNIVESNFFNSVDKLSLGINIKIPRVFFKKVNDISAENFFKNLKYCWIF